MAVVLTVRMLQGKPRQGFLSAVSAVVRRAIEEIHRPELEFRRFFVQQSVRRTLRAWGSTLRSALGSAVEWFLRLG